MRRTIELDGPDWTVEGFLGLDAALGAAQRSAAGRPSGDRPAAIPASVPGSILDDVARAGLVADPYVGRNSLAAEWVPERAWCYRRHVEVPALAPGERAWLAFDGLDHAGAVFWDGEAVGRHEGMFVPFEVDLTDRLAGADAGAGAPAGAGAAAQAGIHELAVVVEPAPASEPQVGRTSRVRDHKSRMGYGWDFCPRMVHQGLWQSVRLETAGDVRIVEVWARPLLSADRRAATVEVRVALDAAAARPVRLEAEVAGPVAGAVEGEAGGLEPAGRAATAADVPTGRSEVMLRLEVREPALWWSNGMGDPATYGLRVRLRGDDELDDPLDERTVPVGFRTIETIPNEDAPRDARPWTWVVNGRRTYIRGWNWVPLDAQYGVPRPERLEHLIRLARDARVNLLRVWGGGLIETRAFYDACDAAGILVWQEFALSSSLRESTPSDDPAFVDLLAGEARAIVPLRRNHPSLAAWCGGNELEDADGPLDEDRSPALRALGEVVRELDPGRIWLPTSPSGPRFHNRLDVIDADPDGLHDVHGPWEHQGLRGQQELYDRGTSLFNSEFGVEGLTNRRMHERLIPPAELLPPTRANAVYRQLGDWWVNEPLVQAAFGGRLDDLERLRWASQRLQADGLRYAVEANRRRAFRNSGSIPWQLNESYPNAWCTAAIDHRGDPKLAYFAVRRAYAPVVVAAQFDRTAWGGAGAFEASLVAWADDPVTEPDGGATRLDGRAGEPVPPLRGSICSARLVDADGAVLAAEMFRSEHVTDAPVALGSIRLDAPLPDVFLLDLVLHDTDGLRLAGNRYLFGGTEDLAPLLDVAAAALDITIAAEGDRWLVEVANPGGPVALGVRIENDRPVDAPGWAEVDDDGFDLLPGETRIIGVTWTSDDAAVPARRLRVSALNAPGSVVAGPREATPEAATPVAAARMAVA